MQEIYIEYVQKVVQNKKQLEQELGVKITNKGKLVFVDGEADKEFEAIQVMEAINLDFSINQALLLKNEDIILQTINIKDITKRHDLGRVRARIIGTQGKTLKTLNNITGCEFSLSDNQVGIIGHTENIEDARQAIISLIQGSKQSNVYTRAEKLRKQKRLEPIGLDLKDESYNELE